MDMNVLSLSTKSHNTKRTYLTPSNDGNILLSHKDTATHHPIDLAVYAIKCAHGGVGLPDPTRNSYISSILEAAWRKASKSVNRRDPITKDMLI